MLKVYFLRGRKPRKLTTHFFNIIMNWDKKRLIKTIKAYLNVLLLSNFDGIPKGASPLHPASRSDVLTERFSDAEIRSELELEVDPEVRRFETLDEKDDELFSSLKLMILNSGWTDFSQC